jgi:hypothetical protein
MTRYDLLLSGRDDDESNQNWFCAVAALNSATGLVRFGTCADAAGQIFPYASAAAQNLL